MTTPTQPATAETTGQQQIRTAANTLRTLGAHATEGPWYEDWPAGVYAYGPAGQDGCPRVFRDPDARYDDIQWITALDPTAAGHLADLLEAAADRSSACYGPALAVARIVNGNHPDREGDA